MAALDDPSRCSAFLEAIELGRNPEAAARELLGVSGRSVRNYAAKHAGFRDDLAAARRRSKIISHHAPRMLPAVANPPMGDPPPGDPGESASIALYPDPCSPAGRRKLFKLLWDHSEDGGSKGCSKALDVLAQLSFAPEILAMQAKAKRDAQLEQAGEKSTRPVVIRYDRRPKPVIEPEIIDVDSSETVTTAVKDGLSPHPLQ